MRNSSLTGWIILILAVFITQAVAQHRPERLVSLAPSLTEIICKLGAQDLLVGRTEFCQYPSAVRRVPQVGGNPDFDYSHIAALEPDLVILQPDLELERKLQRLNLKTFTLSTQTIDEVLQSIQALGRILNRSAKAGEIVQGIQDTLSWLAEQTPGLPVTSSLILLGRGDRDLSAFYAAGPETYLSELLALSNMQNALQDSSTRYTAVTEEEVLAANPEALVVFQVDHREQQSSTGGPAATDWHKPSTLAALQIEQVFVLNERFYLIPGPRIAQAAVALHQIFNPAQE